MPLMDAVTAVEEILRHCPPTKILILTVHEVILGTTTKIIAGSKVFRKKRGAVKNATAVLRLRGEQNGSFVHGRGEA